MIRALWLRLSDREEIPRRWWWPYYPTRVLSREQQQAQHTQCSKTMQHVLLALTGFCFFCLLALGAPDAVLLGEGRPVTVPFAGAEIDFLAFLFLGPAVLVGLTIYLHIYIGYWIALGAQLAPERSLFLFNLDAFVPRLLSSFLFYWLAPLVLLRFAWKAAARPEAPLLLFFTALISGALLWLQIRRCPDHQRRQNRLRWIALIGLILLIWQVLGGSVASSGFRVLHLSKADLHERDLRGFRMAKADLRKANLNGADLSEADLSEADLRGANLRKANLSEAFLSGADLRLAFLSEADLSRADLFQAHLVRAHLSKAHLRLAFLSKANLSKANLSKANLSGADLFQAHLFQAHLNEATLRRANLFQAHLRGADLNGATLRRANLNEADLNGADLRRADLNGADLNGADLSGADLSGADLRRAKNFRSAQFRLAWAAIDDQTQLPSGCGPPYLVQ